MNNSILANFQNISVLVIGDLMIDNYLHGMSTRINPEAPVPVVDILSETIRLGGAGNTAVNLNSLGAKVTFYSVVGDDEYGHLAMELLSKEQIDGKLVKVTGRKTMVKTRVIAGNQILLRYDIGADNAIDDETETALMSLLEATFDSYDAIVISDYNKGVITKRLVEKFLKQNIAYNKFIAIDSKRLEVFKCLVPSLVKPNYSEIVNLLNIEKQYLDRKQQISELGSEIFRSTNSILTAVTLDTDGSIIFEKGKYAYWCPSHDVAPHHSSGAGDTYFSALLLSILSDATIPQATEIASAAARIGLEKSTTSVCTNQELLTYLSRTDKYIPNIEKLKDLCSYYQSRKKKIVFTNGCFDIIHCGHVEFLNRSRELGNILIVGINSDESILRLKGFSPINSLEDRVKVLAGLGAVDHIVSFGDLNDDTASKLLSIIRPNVFTKGDDCTSDLIPEASLVKQQGGEIAILPIKKSTGELIRKITMNPNALSLT